MHFSSALLSATFALGAAAASSSSQSVITVFYPLEEGAGQYAGSIITSDSSKTVLAVACTSGSLDDGCVTNQTATITVGPSTFAETQTLQGTGTISVSCQVTGTTNAVCGGIETYSADNGTALTTSVTTTFGPTLISQFQQAITITAGATTSGGSGSGGSGSGSSSGGSSGGSTGSGSGTGASGASQTSSGSSGGSTNAAAAATMGPLAVAGMAVPAGLAMLVAAL